MRRGNGFIGSFGAAMAAAGLATGLCLAWSADAQPQRGEWLEVTANYVDGEWEVDSPEGYTIIGFDGFWAANDDWSREAAFDGDFGNFAHTPDGSLLWVGLDLGEGRQKEITGIRMSPRDGFANRAVGATIYGANEFDADAYDPTPGSGSDDRGDAVALVTIEAEPTPGEWNTFDIDEARSFRYVFYEASADVHDNHHTDLAVIEFYGLTPVVEVAPRSYVVVAPGGQTELGPVLLHEDYEADATFEWFFEGELLEGETGPGLLIDEATVEQDGTYTVVVRHPDFDDPVAEFDIVVRVFEAQAPAAGVLGLGALAGALALLGGMRRMRR